MQRNSGVILQPVKAQITLEWDSSYYSCLNDKEMNFFLSGIK